MAKEIQGKEVGESDLIPGIRYWITPNNGSPTMYNICSGVFQEYYRNAIGVRMIRFVDSYFLYHTHKFMMHGVVSHRHWHPYKPLSKYYEIRTLSTCQTDEIIQEARRRFERRVEYYLQTYTELSKDIAIHIAKFAMQD